MEMSLKEGLEHVDKSIKEIAANRSGVSGQDVGYISSREVRINTIKLSVVECSNIPIPVKKELLIAECCKKWGCTRRTALEYLTQLVAETSIFIDDADVWSFEQWLKIEKVKKEDYLKGQETINKFF